MAEGSEAQRRQLEFEWYIRGCVLSSLLLQVLLYWLAPLRRRTCSRWLLCLVSVLFSLSTRIATFTLVLICSRAVYGHEGTSEYNPPLLMWAALMLLHMSGYGQERVSPHPLLQMSDRSKAFFGVLLNFALYDVILFGIVFLFEFDKEIPTLAPTLSILACTRTFSKLKHLRDLRKEVEELDKSTAQFPTGASIAQSDETQITPGAHKLFQNSQKLFWGYGLTESEHKACRTFFLGITPRHAIRMVEVEHNLIYDKFYGGHPPAMFEIIMTPLLPIIEAYFTSLSSSLWYPPIQNCINCKPVILVDSLIFYMAAVIYITPLIANYLRLLTQQSFHNVGNNCHMWSWLLVLQNHQPWRHGWSRTIHRFNLLAYGLRKPRKLLAFISYLLNICPISHGERCTDDVAEFIFKELKTAASRLDHEAGSAKGQWVLFERHQAQDLVGHTFEETVLLWHLATGILYHTCSTNSSSSTMSMLLSDYMAYLLMVQPWVMSKKRGNGFRRSPNILSGIHELIHSNQKQADDQTWTLKEVCLRMQSLNYSREDPTQSVVQDACELVKKIQPKSPDLDKMWKFISEVWVEMLAYATVQSDPMSHIRGLTQGGELATVVWLCMAHFGFMQNNAKSSRRHQEREPSGLKDASPTDSQSSEGSQGTGLKYDRPLMFGTRQDEEYKWETQDYKRAMMFMKLGLPKSHLSNCGPVSKVRNLP